MGLLRRKPYSRRDSLEMANRAQRKGKPKKAIAAYQKIIEHDGEDPMVLHKLAMALAETSRTVEARTKFLAAAGAYEERGFVEKALAVYVTASHYLPKDVEIWERIADTQIEKGNRAEAIKLLLDARKHFARSRQRPERMRLLARVRAVEPWHFEATYDLARLLTKTGDRGGATTLYQELAARNEGRLLRRVRGALFRLSPTPTAAYRWIRALLLGR